MITSQKALFTALTIVSQHGSLNAFLSSTNVAKAKPLFSPRFVTLSPHVSQKKYSSKPFSTTTFFSSKAASNNVDTTKQDIPTTDSEIKWFKHALLISSFGDGVEQSKDAKEFLKNRIISSMVSKHIQTKENSLKESVIASPCNGPDINMLNELEKADETFLKDDSKNADQILEQLILNSSSSSSSPLEIRVLYIPTAMYALRANSDNSPGKQRQRARADGKKRRTLVIQQLQELFDNGECYKIYQFISSY